MDVASAQGAIVLASKTSRAVQMNVGARAATGDALVFLHADTVLPAGFDGHVCHLLASAGNAAGAFLLAIDGSKRGYRIVEHLANWRSKRLHMPYGDQGIFLRAAVFHAAGGFPDIPIMEDFELIRRLRACGRIVIAPVAALTSARRWQTVGILLTTLLNQAAILAYCLGIPPAHILRMLQMKPSRPTKTPS